ncbi:MAG TPA: hypothetical protein VFD71_20115, partial [Planctomycetota bacterium]|nr:hypothetical protein [Planctomycetota bacterium]
MEALFHFFRATPAGEGGVAVFELYGPGAPDALRRAFRLRGGGELPRAGQARLGELRNEHGDVVDEAILARV